MASINIKWIIIFFVVVIAVALLVWFCTTQCTYKQHVGARTIGHPTPVHGRNSNRSPPYSPFISPYPPEPPPLGFGDSVDMPQPDMGDTHRFNENGPVDTYPPTRGAPYPLNSGNNRAPYPAETSCYPPAHEAPYPVTNSMPQPSILRIREPSNSTRITPYPPAHQAPYPVTNSMPQPSTSRIRELSSSTRITPYTPAEQAPYPPSSECIIPRPSLSRTQRTTGQTAYSRRRAPASSAPYPPANTAPYPPASSAPYPPASSTSFSSELPPPTYEDAVNNKI